MGMVRYDEAVMGQCFNAEPSAGITHAHGMKQSYSGKLHLAFRCPNYVELQNFMTNIYAPCPQK